jgi:tetratricopeptide (TPR) repeat protein
MAMENRITRTEMILALGGDQLLLGRHDNAIARFQEALRFDPNCSEAHAWLGKAFRETGRFDEAEQAFLEAVRLRPDFALARFNLGLLYVARGEIEKALEQYQALKALHPTRADRLYEQIALKGKLEEVVREQHGRGGAAHGKGRAKTSEPAPGRSRPGGRRARPPIETVRDEPPVPRIVTTDDPEPAAGPALVREAPLELPAHATAEEGASRPPEERRPAPTETAHPAALHPPRPRIAPEAEFRPEPLPRTPAPPEFPPDSPPETATGAQPADAPDVQALRTTAAADPRDSDAQWRLGLAYVEAREYARAAEAFEKAIANRPDFGGTHPESVRDSIDMCLRLGLCHERLGRFEAASAVYEQALDMDPEQPEINLRAGLVMLVLNNRREADRCYRTLARLDPQRAELLLQRLLRVQSK